MYGDMIDDPKIGTLNDKQFRLWTSLLCLACQAGNGGNTNLTVAEIEWKLRKKISKNLKVLLDRELVVLKNENSDKQTIFVNKWEKRQYQSDSSTNRVKKFRNN